MRRPSIIIIDSNVLACLGLKNILNKLYPEILIQYYNSVESYTASDQLIIIHCFLSIDIYLKNKAYFLDRKQKIILLGREEDKIKYSTYNLLNIFQIKDNLIKDIQTLFLKGIKSHKMQMELLKLAELSVDATLTPREKEILSYIANGYLNKEIANKLNISVYTVINHRKNLTDKLGIKSIPDLINYANVNNLLDL